MIFIFDWGFTTQRKIGPLSQSDLPFAIQSEFVWLVIERAWFRAFFIPLIPTSKKYLLVSLEDKSTAVVQQDFFEKFKDLAHINYLSMEGKISDAEYSERRDKMNL